jgi:vitamin B12 transporter
MPKILFYTVALGALGLGLAAEARDIGATPLEAVVVTANRSPERANHVGQQITVLNAAELTRQQTPLLTEIIARTPGVAFSRNGPAGSVTQVYVRGAEPGQTLVLIDGVKLNNPSAPDSAFNFGNLLLGDVDRVEILRGPQSTLWGSQAIGGVINLITASPAKPFEADASFEGGSHAWGAGRAGLGGKTDRINWRVGGAFLTTSGVSAYDRGREADGTRNVGATGRAEIRLTDQLGLDLRAVYSRGRVEFDGFPAPAFSFADTAEYGITQDFVGYAGANLALLDGRLKNRLAYAYTRTTLRNHNPDQAVTDLTFSSLGRNERVEYQGTLAVTSGWTAVFGAETERSFMRTASPSAFNPNPAALRNHAQLDSGYLQVRGEVAPGVTLTGGVRHDDHSTFGGHTVSQASAAWRLNGGATVLRASWGQGFKAPSLYQLGSQYGNLALRPESSTGWDAGVEQSLFDGRLLVQGAWFQRRTRQQIDFFSCFGASAAADPLCKGPSGAARFGYYDNIARTKARGLELAATASLTDTLRLQVNDTWLDARNDVRGSANFGKRLARRAEHQANADLDYRWPNDTTTTLAAHYVGERFDNATNTVRLKGYVLWDLRAAYPVTPQVEVFGRVENLFDERFETTANYGQLGRTAYAGVRARF